MTTKYLDWREAHGRVVFTLESRTEWHVCDDGSVEPIVYDVWTEDAVFIDPNNGGQGLGSGEDGE